MSGLIPSVEELECLHYHLCTSTDSIQFFLYKTFFYHNRCLVVLYQSTCCLRGQIAYIMLIILVWPTCRTPAAGGLIVCESVCPKTCRHIARRMVNG